MSLQYLPNGIISYILEFDWLEKLRSNILRGFIRIFWHFRLIKITNNRIGLTKRRPEPDSEDSEDEVVAAFCVFDECIRRDGSARCCRIWRLVCWRNIKRVRSRLCETRSSARSRQRKSFDEATNIKSGFNWYIW